LIETRGVNLVVDIGANTGQFAREIRTAGYQGEIISFEPLLGPFQELARMAARDSTLRAERRAIGDRSCVLPMVEAGSSVTSSLRGFTELGRITWGNDTIWRTCLDLNKILLYGLPDGSMRPDRLDQRRTHLVFLDAIISGEGAGPMRPDPVRTRFVAFGMNPAGDERSARSQKL
jgi:hypothetical protein